MYVVCLSFNIFARTDFPKMKITITIRNEKNENVYCAVGLIKAWILLHQVFLFVCVSLVFGKRPMKYDKR